MHKMKPLSRFIDHILDAQYIDVVSTKIQSNLVAKIIVE